MPDEVPPRWMWHIEDELESWFDNVDRERKDRFSGGDKDDDDFGGMMSNDLAKGRGK